MKSWLRKIGSNLKVQAFLGMLVGLYAMFVYKTCKWQKVGLFNYRKELGFFSFWHSQIMMVPLLAREADMAKSLRAIVSNHRDGRLAGAFLEFLNVTPINGSTGRGGARAMFETIKLLKSGDSVVGICPDGPRGPACEVSKGTMAIANMANVPLYCVAYAVKNHIKLKTWDKFVIPFPFSKGVMLMSEPFYLDKNPDEKRLEELRLEFQRFMNDNTKKAFDLVSKM